MAVYGPIQSDARVIRAARSLSEAGHTIQLISLNSDENYTSPWFDSIFIKDDRKYLSLIHFLSKVLHIAIKKRPDILYLHDYYMPIVGKVYKLRTGKKWVYDAHELIIPEKKSTTMRMRFFAFLERFSISSASLVVAANEERLAVMKETYQIKESVAIQNISDYTTRILPQEPLENKENIIVYQGAMMTSRHIDFYVRAHKLLSSDYSLLLIGDGDSMSNLKSIAIETKIADRIIFTGKVTQKELYDYSAKAKIGIISYPLEGLNNYYCAPNKIYEYAALKIPMIGTPQPFLKHMFEKYHIGEIVQWDDMDAYVGAINKICNNYNKYLEGMDAFLKDNCWQNESDKLQSSVANILI